VSKAVQLARRRAREAQAARERVLAKRRRIFAAGGAVAAVVVVLLVFILVKIALPDKTTTTTNPPAGASTSLTNAVNSVPAATLDKVARGTQGTLPKRISGQPALTEQGKPLVLYVGAEYCPFCAAQRWSLAVALARFGTFTNLKQAWSASDDVYPSTPTISFHGSTYKSDYLSFQAVELATSQREGGQYAPLESLTPAQEQIMRKYDSPPYVASGSQGAVPFLDMGNTFVMAGSSFSPDLLKGMTPDQVAALLSRSEGTIPQSVLGPANAMTAMLCELTGGKPGNVCTSPAATAYKDVAGAH